MEARLTEINRLETLQYLSYRGETLSDSACRDLDRCEAQVLAMARPRMAWRSFSLGENGRLVGTDFCPAGESIRALLASCHSVILFAATLGGEIEAMIRRTQLVNMGDALILDAASSAAIENVCDNLCADLAKQFALEYLTDRFSPGYGDFPLEQQRDFFRLLDIYRRIGVSLTESGLMVPQKTVTALIGVSSQPQPKREQGCTSCKLFETCAYRKEGKSCGKN